MFDQSGLSIAMGMRTRQVVGEPVTAKELEVLRLLTTPMSRRAIADRLYVSLNTAGPVTFSAVRIHRGRSPG